MSFSNRVVQSRLKLGMNQEELARAHGLCTVSSVKMWENYGESDENFPNSKNLKRLAIVLKVDEVWLRFGDPKSQPHHFQPKDDILPIALINDSNRIMPPTLNSKRIGAWLESKRTIIEGQNMAAEKIQTTLFYYTVTNHMLAGLSLALHGLLKGKQLLIDPCVKEYSIEAGDWVLVQYGMTDNYKLRYIEKDGPQQYYASLNPNVPPVEKNENQRLIGKVLEVISE